MNGEKWFAKAQSESHKNWKVYGKEREVELDNKRYVSTAKKLIN